MSLLSSAALSTSEVMLVKKLSEHAIMPIRGSALSAGFDLASAVDTIIPAKGKGIVATDLSIATPKNTYARIAPRSGLAVKKFIDVGAGVVDEDYRGPVGVVLFNFSDNDFEVKRGDRIAQLVLERICLAAAVEVDDLDATERGAAGFGSTGVAGTAAAAGESAEKRQRSVVTPSDEVSTMTELLKLVATIGDASERSKVKELLLAGDSKVAAAVAVYMTNSDKGDLLETFKVIAKL
jgi:dUTP pyrophosphatase